MDEVIVLANRGFGRTELARTCQQLGFHYARRIKPQVYVECREFQGKLTCFPVKRGTQCLLKNVQFRKQTGLPSMWLFAGKRGCRRIATSAGF